MKWHHVTDFFFRQAQDRYYDPAMDGSLNGFPVGSDYKGGGSGVHQMDTLNRGDYDGSDLASHQQAAYMQSQQLLREHNAGLASLPPQTPIMNAQAGLRSQTPVMMAPTPVPPHHQGSAFNLAGANAVAASRMSTQTLPTMAHPPQQQPYILPQGLFHQDKTHHPENDYGLTGSRIKLLQGIIDCNL